MLSQNTQLLLDTSTERGIVALAREGEILYEKLLDFGLMHSRALLFEIDRGFSECGLSVQELTSIGVGAGPGSHTGIRVAQSIAKGLAFPDKIPIYGLSSLKAFDIGSKPSSEECVMVVVDARTPGVYRWKIGEEEVERLSFEAWVRELVGRSWKIVTPNAAPLLKRLGDKVELSLQWEERAPSAASLLVLLLREQKNVGI